MQTVPSKECPPSSVRARFDDGMSTFLLSFDATLEDLACRLGQLAEQHRGRPLAVDVRLGSLAP